MTKNSTLKNTIALICLRGNSYCFCPRSKNKTMMFILASTQCLSGSLTHCHRAEKEMQGIDRQTDTEAGR